MPRQPERTTIKNYHGREIDVEVVKRRTGGGARVELEHPDGRRWRLDVKSTGTLEAVVTTWDGDELADIGVPDWIDDLLTRLQRR